MMQRWLLTLTLTTLLTLALDIDHVHAQGAFAPEASEIANGATAVAVGDLDRDGDLDAWFGFDGDSRVYRWTDGAWADSGQRLGEDDLVVDVVLGDFDADGDVDAAVLDVINLTIWVNVGGKQNRAESIFEFRARFTVDVASRLGLGDLDNDDDLDLYISHNVGRPDLIWLNDGDANFSDSGLRLGNASASDVALGDLDGDGDLDALVATGISSAQEPAPLNEIWINTTNHITPVADLFIDSGLHLGERSGFTVALNDVDGDGDLDAWISHLNGGDTLWINQGGAQSGTEGNFVARGESFGGPGRDLVFADVDGDEDQDLVKVSVGSGVGVWLNQGGFQRGTLGDFAFRGQSVQTPAERIALGAFNEEDELPDLLIAPFANDLPTTFWFNGDTQAVATFRALRDDEMAATPQGRHYIELYEQFTAEILTLMLTNPTLNANLWAGLDLWKPAVDALLTGDGDYALLSGEQIKFMDEVLENLELVGSDELQNAIAEERAALGKPLDDFVGMSISKVTLEVLGEPSYSLFVPSVHQSTIQSSAQWLAQPAIFDPTPPPGTDPGCFAVCLWLAGPYCILGE